MRVCIKHWYGKPIHIHGKWVDYIDQPFIEELTSEDITDLAIQGDIQLRYRPDTISYGKEADWILYMDTLGGGFRQR